MNLLIVPVLILSGILVLGVMFVSARDQTAPEINVVPAIPDVTVPVQTVLPASTAVSAPVETPYPAPSYTPPVIRSYSVNREHDIWHAEDPASYITPENAWVKYFASQLYIDYDGRVRYKDRPVPLRVDTKGNVLQWIDEPLINNYSFDIYGKVDKNNIPWLMPDYYLTHGLTGVCSAWAVTVTSLMLSGEMSLKENGGFVKGFIPAKAVLGYMGSYRDGWVEYRAYGKIFLTTTGLVNAGIDGSEKRSATEFIEKNEKTTARPVFEFTDAHFGQYKEW